MTREEIQTKLNQYVHCMEKLKQRLHAVELVSSGNVRTPYPATDLEFCCLQIRMCLELIALAAMVANQEEYAKFRASFRTDWHATKILENIEKANPNFYPKPTVQILEDGRPKSVEVPSGGVDWGVPVDTYYDQLSFDDSGNFYLCGKESLVGGRGLAKMQMRAPNGDHLWTVTDEGVLGSETGSAGVVGNAFLNTIRDEATGYDMSLQIRGSAGQELARSQSDLQGNQDLFARAVTLPGGDTYILSGTEIIIGIFNGNFLPRVTKLNSSGGTEWTRSFPGTFARPFDGVSETPDNGVVVGAGGSLHRYSPSGDLIWTLANLGLLGTDFLGNTYAVGEDLRKYSVDGNLLWQAPILYSGYPVPPPYLDRHKGETYYVFYDSNRYTLFKHGTDGELLWSRFWFGDLNDPKMTTDDAGNLFVFVPFGPEYNLKKFSPSGELLLDLLANDIHINPSSRVQIATDSSGNLYVAGRDHTGLVTIKFDSNGQKLWSRSRLVGHDPRAHSLVIGPDGSVYVGANEHTNNQAWDYVVVKYLPNGDLAWPSTGDVFRKGAAVYDSGKGLNDFIAHLGLDATGAVYAGGVAYGPNRTPDLHLVKFGGNLSSVVSVQAPGEMVSGQTYPVSIALKNTGETPWTPQVSLIPVGDQSWGVSSIPIYHGQNVPPGETKTFSFNVIAPPTDGAHTFRWSLSQDGVPFGEEASRKPINVIKREHAARNESGQSSQTVTAGSSFTVKVRVRNVGTKTWTAADGFRLASTNPEFNTNWGPSVIQLAPGEVVAPGQVKEFNFTCTAPSTAGIHTMTWQMHRQRTGAPNFFFGDLASHNIAVLAP